MTLRRIVVIDDQTIFREMLVEIFSAQPGYDVVGQFSRGDEALRECTRLRPEVAVVDVVLPDVSGIDLVRSLRASMRSLSVLFVTAHERPSIVRDALEVGAAGMVVKGAPLRELKEAMERIVRGGTYFCSTTSALIRDAAMHPPPRTDLSPRERQIVKLVASGLSTKEIAARLGLSAKTVSNHRFHVRNKLGLHDVASVTRYAVEQGLVEKVDSRGARET